MAFEPLKKLRILRIESIATARTAIEDIVARVNQIIDQFNAGGGGGGGGGGAGVDSFNGRTGVVLPQAGDYPPALIGAVPTSHLSAPDPHPQYQREVEKGVANGYASLDVTGKVPAAQLPLATSTFSFWDPNKPPAVPHANDVDVANGTVAWPGAWVNQAIPFDYESFTDLPSRLVIKGAGSAWKGRALAIPVGDFQVAMKVKVLGLGSNFQLVGFHVASDLASLNTGGAAIAAFVGYHNGHGGWCVSTEGFAGPPTLGDWGNSPIAEGTEIIMRWRRLAGVFYFDWSVDGAVWVTGVAGSAVGSAAYIHVAYYSSQPIDTTVMEIDWIRFVANGSYTQSYGGLRTVNWS